MLSIQADAPSRQERGFPSPAEAIAGGKLMNAQREQGKGSELAVGKVIASGHWDEERVFLELSEGLLLSLWCDGESVEWKVTKHQSYLASEPMPSGREPILIHLNNMQFVWDRAQIMRKIIGRAVARIDAGEVLVFVSVMDIPSICFSVLRDRARNRSFLHWDFET